MGLISSVKGCMGPNVYPDVPNGGWGWVVAVAFFFVEAFTYGFIRSFAIFREDIMAEFNESSNRVMWVVPICVFTMGATAPLSTVLSNRFGFRPTVMVGGFLMSLGTISSSFTRSINEMYITLGIVLGLGCCLTFLPTITILSQYFSRRRFTVVSVASLGECIFPLALGLAKVFNRNAIGWHDYMVVIGVLQVSVIGCGVLLRPIVIKPKQAAGDSPSSPLENEYTCTSSSSVDTDFQPLSASRTNLNNAQQVAPSQASPDTKSLDDERAAESCLKNQEDNEGQGTAIVEPSEPTTAISPASTKLLDFTVLRDVSFICYSLSGLFATLVTSLRFYITLPHFFTKVMDMDAIFSAPLHIAITPAEFMGRLSGGCLVDCLPLRKINVMLLCMVLLTGVSVASVLGAGMLFLAICSIFFCYHLAAVCSMHIPMLAEDDVLGINLMPSAVGIYACIQSFGVLAVPLLLGFLPDKTQNIDPVIQSCVCVGIGLGALFLGLVRPLRLCQGKMQEGAVLQET